MNELTQDSIDFALSAPENAREALHRAEAFTAAHRESVRLPRAERESILLDLQFPACLRPPRSGDLLAGRIFYPMVGFSPEAMGLGYYCADAFFEQWRKDARATADEARRCQAVLDYWAIHRTSRKVREAYPEAIALLLPSDAWMEESGEVIESLLDGERPKSFHAATQLLWIMALLSGSWNYGRLDVTLGGFLEQDLTAGVLDEEGAVALLRSLWRLIHAYNNQYNNRVIVGGRGRPDEVAADRFALLAIEATRRERLNQPQLTLRFYTAQNPRLWERALDAIGEGCTFPMLYNDDVNVPAVAKAFGVSEAEAVDYLPYGCGEYVLGPHAVNAPNGVINLLKALEIALHGGVDPLSGRTVLELPAAASFANFEDLWQAHAAVVEHFVAALAVTQKIQYEVAAEEAPFSFFSMLLDDCAECGQPVFSGGVRRRCQRHDRLPQLARQTRPHPPRRSGAEHEVWQGVVRGDASEV
ncbi:MAG: hypothetical protein GVY36_01150 [Verrucomicrobia bacterium]|jgi:hypothetical protein|nr:hypothetical protein [Verrucomicrobiota bacterium]